MQITVHTIRDTEKLAGDIIALIKEYKPESDVSERATVLALSGPLGSGKTTLTKCIAAVLGVSDIVTSPSFVLRSDYATDDAVFRNLVHIDAYRITDGEVGTIGWGDILVLPNTLIVVEWPEHISASMPPRRFSVTADVSGNIHTFTVTTP